MYLRKSHVEVNQRTNGKHPDPTGGGLLWDIAFTKKHVYIKCIDSRSKSYYDLRRMIPYGIKIRKDGSLSKPYNWQSELDSPNRPTNSPSSEEVYRQCDCNFEQITRDGCKMDKLRFEFKNEYPEKVKLFSSNLFIEPTEK